MALLPQGRDTEPTGLSHSVSMSGQLTPHTARMPGMGGLQGSLALWTCLRGPLWRPKVSATPRPTPGPPWAEGEGTETRGQGMLVRSSVKAPPSPGLTACGGWSCSLVTPWVPHSPGSLSQGPLSGPLTPSTPAHLPPSWAGASSVSVGTPRTPDTHTASPGAGIRHSAGSRRQAAHPWT